MSLEMRLIASLKESQRNTNKEYMAINKQMLQKLLNNPANVSAEDLESEELDSAQSADEYQLPEELGEAVEDATDEEMIEPVIKPAVDDSSRMRVQSSPDKFELDPEIAGMMKKLKAGEPLESDEDEQESAEVASDMRAPVDLRKKALQRIKQKYLGQ